MYLIYFNKTRLDDGENAKAKPITFIVKLIEGVGQIPSLGDCTQSKAKTSVKTAPSAVLRQ